MRKAIVCIYDKQAMIYGTPLTYENQDLAIAQIRRGIRDMYFRDEVTFDKLCDEELIVIGEYESSTGALFSIDEKDYVRIPCDSFFKLDELKESDRKNGKA